MNRENLASRLVALRDANGVDIAVGLIIDWQSNGNIAVVKAPEIDMKEICCFVIGDVSIDIHG